MSDKTRYFETPSWFSTMVLETSSKGQGLPDSSWVMLSGAPGSGKTTVGMVLLDYLIGQDRVEGLYINEEMTAEKRESMQNALKCEHLNGGHADIHDLLDKGAFQQVLLDHAERAAEDGYTLVILIDSLQSFYNPTSNASAIKLAQFLEQLKKNYPVIILTVGHLTKSRSFAGPALFQQACEVRVDVSKDASGFFHLDTSIKNRYYNPKGQAQVKLARTDQGLVPSSEPDFISNNKIVSSLRELWRRK